MERTCKMKLVVSGLLCACLTFSLKSQVCDPSNPPFNLISTFAPGAGVLLQWDAVPGSVGIQLRADLPSGVSIVRRIAGFERDFYLIPESALSPGVYTWSVQAACSPIPPYNVTPVSSSASFTFGSTGSTCPATVTDIDGNVYPTVEIGAQCWMQENLKVEHYANGDPIPMSLVDSLWEQTLMGAVSTYNNEIINKTIYGLLYNWHTTVDSRGLCPIGWHVPSDSEWSTLVSFLGSIGGNVGGQLKETGTLGAGTGLWLSPNSGATNSSGFSGRPSGVRDIFGSYADFGVGGYWWSSTEESISRAWFYVVAYGRTDVIRTNPVKNNGHAIRCLKN